MYLLRYLLFTCASIISVFDVFFLFLFLFFILVLLPFLLFFPLPSFSSSTFCSSTLRKRNDDKYKPSSMITLIINSSHFDWSLSFSLLSFHLLPPPFPSWMLMVLFSPIDSGDVWWVQGDRYQVCGEERIEEQWSPSAAQDVCPSPPGDWVPPSLSPSPCSLFHLIITFSFLFLSSTLDHCRPLKMPRNRIIKRKAIPRRGNVTQRRRKRREEERRKRRRR